MDSKKIITLIAESYPAEAIARAAGITVDAVVAFAQAHKQDIADSMMERLMRKATEEDTVYEIKDLAFKEIKKSIPFSGLTELTTLLKVLNEMGDQGVKTDTAKTVNMINFTFNEVLKREIKAIVNEDGEVVAVDGRDIMPAGRDMIEEIYNERQAASRKVN